MTATLVELTASIVASHAAGSDMSGDDLIQEINKVYSILKKLETEGVATEAATAPGAPAMSIKKAFQNDQVCCLICGKTGFKTLTRHLKQAHDLKPGQYRKQFNIPSSQSLTAKNYSEARRKAANENNLAANLEKARAARAAKKGGTTKPLKAAKVAAKPEKAVKATPKTVKNAKPAKPKTAKKA
ncbi:MAG TPA: MucR family transcriptional regulator [Desulfuromonadaceae bacterium]|jgi:predicted transcriptional regulator